MDYKILNYNCIKNIYIDRNQRTYIYTYSNYFFVGQTQVKPELLNFLPSKKTSTQCDIKSKPLPKDCILNSILNLQKLSLEIDDITAEALSDKMMSEVKSQEELHNLTIWYPLLTGSRKGIN